jgi:hypothetical protein
MPGPRGLEKDAPRCSESSFDNSKVRPRCKSITRPSGSDSWIYGRYAVLRIITEKILIRAQSNLFRPPRNQAQNAAGLGNGPLRLRTEISSGFISFLLLPCSSFLPKGSLRERRSEGPALEQSEGTVKFTNKARKLLSIAGEFYRHSEYFCASVLLSRRRRPGLFTWPGLDGVNWVFSVWNCLSYSSC